MSEHHVSAHTDTPIQFPASPESFTAQPRPIDIPKDVWDTLSVEDRARVAYLSEQISTLREAIHFRLEVNAYAGQAIAALDSLLAPVTGGTRTDIVEAEDTEMRLWLYESELNKIMWRATHEANQRRLDAERQRNERLLETERRERERDKRVAKRQRANDTAIAARNAEAAEDSSQQAGRANKMALAALVVAVLTLLFGK